MASMTICRDKVQGPLSDTNIESICMKKIQNSTGEQVNTDFIMFSHFILDFITRFYHGIFLLTKITRENQQKYEVNFKIKTSLKDFVLHFLPIILVSV